MTTRSPGTTVSTRPRARGRVPTVGKVYPYVPHGLIPRYPDEDAGNPFEANQGSNAKPHYPLGPAAVINGAAMSRDEMARREEEEEVERIRNNIGTKTVSTALLQALMP